MAVGAIAVFVLLGLLNVFGSRSATSIVARGPLRAALAYPAVTRGGLPTEWTLHLEHTGGGRLGDVTVRTSLAYFELFDRNDIVPTPDGVEQDDRWVTWRFEDVTSPALVIRLDMRTQPNARWRRGATTAVAASGEQVELSYSTWVAP